MQQSSQHTGVSDASPQIVFGEQEARYRQIHEGLATKDECARLVRFADASMTLGDGYGGDANPHTDTETFYGYTFHVPPGATVPEEHLLALRIIQRARKAVMQHFRLRFLWLDFAHLVMREPLDTGRSPETDELSHPWHYDNQADHVKHRTHTAILYLNDGFEGGLTQFREAEFGPFRQVQPSTGKMIAFAVADNAHAVSKLIKGKRYVLNMWFSTHWSVWRSHRRIFRPL